MELEIAYPSLQADDSAVFTPCPLVVELALFKLLCTARPQQAFSECPSVFVPYGNIRAGLGLGVLGLAKQPPSLVVKSHRTTAAYCSAGPT